MANDRIRYRDGRRLQACQIECLRRSYTGNTVIPADIRYRCKRDISASRIRQITVNLIREHNHMMLRTQHTDSFQRRFVPNLSNRIVWVTENHQHRLRICELLFQVFEINVICISVEYKRTFQHLSAIIQNRVKEYIIHRCLHQHLLGWCCQFPHD